MTITVKDNNGIHIVNVNHVCAAYETPDDLFDSGFEKPNITILFKNHTQIFLNYESREEVQEALEEISRLIEEKQ